MGNIIEFPRGGNSNPEGNGGAGELSPEEAASLMNEIYGIVHSPKKDAHPDDLKPYFGTVHGGRLKQDRPKN